MDLDLEQSQPQHSVFRLWSLKHCRKRKLTEPPDIRPSKWKTAEVQMMQRLKMEIQVERKIKMEMQMEREIKTEAKTLTKNQRESKPKKCCIRKSRQGSCEPAPIPK